MIIGIDASRANRKYKSGTEWYSYYLIRELAKLDNKNQYLLYTDQPLVGGLADLTLDDLTEEPEVNPVRNILKGNPTVAELQGIISNGVKVKAGWQEIISPFSNFRAKILSWPWPFFWTQIRLSLEMLVSPPAVLFVPAHSLPLIHPDKSVVTIHDLGFVRTPELYSHQPIINQPNWHKLVDSLVRLFSAGRLGANVYDYLSWSTEFSLKQAKKIITVSNFSQKEIREIYKIPTEKIKVIYHGLNTNLYQENIDQEKIKARLNKYGLNFPYLLYLGRIDKKKNIGALIEAYASVRQQLPQLKEKLVLAGKADFGFDQVNYTIQEFNLNEQVVMTGWLAEEDLPACYHGATALIMPSVYEGFGLPVIQAMACGLPVAAARAGALQEIAGEAAIYFNPGSKEEMAEAMAKIISDDDLRKRLIREGFTRVKNFSWQKCARETLKVIENL